MDALVDLVSRVPARVQIKLLAAFLAIVTLLIMVGAVGLTESAKGALQAFSPANPWRPALESLADFAVARRA